MITFKKTFDYYATDNELGYYIHKSVNRKKKTFK